MKRRSPRSKARADRRCGDVSARQQRKLAKRARRAARHHYEDVQAFAALDDLDSAVEMRTLSDVPDDQHDH